MRRVADMMERHWATDGLELCDFSVSHVYHRLDLDLDPVYPVFLPDFA